MFRKTALTALGVVTAVLGFATIVNAGPDTTTATQTSVGRQEQCVTDSLSYCTVAHGFGVKPQAVLVQQGNSASIVHVPPSQVTDTRYRVRFVKHDGKGYPAGTRMDYYVHYDLPATPDPDPTPTSTSPTPTATSPTPTANPAACTNPVFTSSDRYATWSNNGYLVNNNIWNEGEAGPQTLGACRWNNWYVVSNQPGSGTDDSVKSYPDTQKHVNIPLSNLPALQSSWKVDTPPGGGTVPAKGKQWNAAYDLWLNNFSVEVMVWTNWTANWQYWYNQYNGVQVTIEGVKYHAYARTTGDRAVWFIRDDVTNTGSVDLAPLLRWAVAKGWLSSSMTLGEIEYGFEIMYTGEPTRFDLLDYTLTTP